MQGGDGCGNRLANRLRVDLGLAIAQDADAVPVFGDVGKIKEQAEGADYQSGVLGIERCHPRG